MFALLAGYAVSAWTASLTKGVSFDEGLQLAVGYNIWINDDLRVEGANGDLIKRWATIPYLFSRPAFVGKDDANWRQAKPYELARAFFFQLGNRPEELLWQARAMVALLGAFTGLLVFLFARELAGPVGGMIALTLFTFSPHFLAFGGIVSTDLSITLALLGSTWSLWHLLHTVTVPRLLSSLGFVSLAILAKPTALVLLPLTVVLVIVRLAARAPLVISWGSWRRTLHRRRAQAALIATLAILHVIVGWTAIWAHYGFRYVASPDPSDPGIVLREQRGRDAVASPVNAVLAWTWRARLLPEGFCKGIDWLVGDDDQLPAFMNGRWTSGGWLAFFPFAIAVKTHPTLFLLTAAGAIALWPWWRRRRHRRPAQPHRGAGAIYGATPHLALVAVYLSVAIGEDLNLGLRHVLPIYPSLHILAGAAGARWARTNLTGILAVVTLLAWQVVDSLAIRPDYLAYFGPQIGGAAKGYQLLVDSSLDWGMDLPGLKRWLDRHDPQKKEPLHLAYFGTDSPKYHGIVAKRLPGFIEPPSAPPFALTPGYYAISATLLQGVYLVIPGPWTAGYEDLYRGVLQNVRIFDATAGDPLARQNLIARHPLRFWDQQYEAFNHLRFARLCAWLRHQGPPPFHVGHSIFIWKLSAADLHAALDAPPVETAPPSPLVHRILFPKAGPTAPR